GGHMVVFSYTMRTTARLVASTDTPGTDPSFDSIIWIADGCGSTAHELACNDDVMGAGNVQSTAVSTATIPAGTHVFIALGGYFPEVGGNNSFGDFSLAVIELVPHA